MTHCPKCGAAHLSTGACGCDLLKDETEIVVGQACKHEHRIGGGSVNEDGSWRTYWHCVDCGASGSNGRTAFFSINESAP